MIKNLLLFDSQDGIKNYDINATDSNVQYYHPYNLYFPLVNPITNINKILLKSIELPIALYNIRGTGTMNLCSIVWNIGAYNNNPYEYRLTPGLYSSISNLMSL